MKRIVFPILFVCLSFLTAAQSTWQSLGPILFPNNVSGQINGIGRTTQMKWDPNNPQVVYATTGEGGLWKSINNGITWSKTGTDVLSFTGTASVCIDHANSQVLYLGTGDPNYYSVGLGIYKSIDGGQTWNPSNTNIGNRMAVELIMDPLNNSVLVAATNNGIWRTSNAGGNWTQTLAATQFTDMKLKPGSNSILYAVNMAGNFYRSTDFGVSWTQITSGLSIPGNNAQGTRLAVSPADPDVVYLGTISGEGAIFKSTDGGTSFTTVYNNPSQSLVGYDVAGGGQGDYNFTMCADPLNANNVYVAAHVVWKSTNGGVTWTQLTNWWETVHTDMHFIGFNPHNTSELFNANDGGVWLTTNGGNSWTIRSDGLEATECYHAASSHVYKELLSIGTQDNGEIYFYNGTWYCNRGGDWTSVMHYDYTSTYGRVYYVEDGERRNVILNGGASSANVPSANKPEFAFSKQQNTLAYAANSAGTNYTVHRSTNLTAGNPAWLNVGTLNGAAAQLEFTPDDPNVLYIVTKNNRVYRTDNALDPAPVFVDFASPATTNFMARIAPCTNASDVVYMSCGNRVYRSADRGATWVNVSGTLPTVNINGLVFDEFSTDESVYLSNAYGVYYRNNTMTDWINYSSGLPSIAQITDLMIFNDGTAGSVIRVSYYGRGVWQRSLYNSQSLSPSANFTASATSICPGTQIQFTDMSIGNPNQWQWSFPGGNPSTSTLQHPVVTYTAPGTYNVTLVSTNTNGNDTEVKSTYITVFPSQPLPLSEGFEGNFPAANWTAVNGMNDGVQWTQTGMVGGFSQSTSSVFADNFNENGGGSHDIIYTPVIDLQNASSASLQFDVAYARYSNDYFDSLLVKVSVDCGATFSTLYAKGGQTLATAPDNSSNMFEPTANQWRTETVDLTAFIGQPTVMFQFINVALWGQVLYLDNINIDVTNPSSVSQNNLENTISNYQAADGSVVIHSANEIISGVDVYNGLGQKISSRQNNASVQFILPSHEFNALGIYYLHITTASGPIVKKQFVSAR